MKYRILTIFLSFLLFGATTYVHGDILEDMGKGAKAVGKEIDKGAKATGDGINKGAEALNKGVKDGHDTLRKSEIYKTNEDSAMKHLRRTQKVTKDTVNEVANPNEKSVENQLNRTGEYLKGTGDQMQRHPKNQVDAIKKDHKTIETGGKNLKPKDKK